MLYTRCSRFFSVLFLQNQKWNIETSVNNFRLLLLQLFDQQRNVAPYAAVSAFPLSSAEAHFVSSEIGLVSPPTMECKYTLGYCCIAACLCSLCSQFLQLFALFCPLPQHSCFAPDHGRCLACLKMLKCTKFNSMIIDSSVVAAIPPAFSLSPPSASE